MLDLEIKRIYSRNLAAYKRRGAYVGDCYRNLTSISKLMYIFIENNTDNLTKDKIIEIIGNGPSTYSQHCNCFISFNLTVSKDNKNGLELNDIGKNLKKEYIEYFNVSSNNKNLNLKKNIYDCKIFPDFAKNVCLNSLKQTKIEDINLLENTIHLWLLFHYYNKKEGVCFKEFQNATKFNSEIFNLSSIDTYKWYDKYLLDLGLIDKNKDITKLNTFGIDFLKNFIANNKIKNYQRIIYGAPGTGKSYYLAEEINKYFPSLTLDEIKLQSIDRVTFYDGYTYSQFVGTYKPISSPKGEVTYSYVGGPLINMIIKAYLHPDTNFCLVIEEINRAKADRVFGNIFQLLDRNKNGYSEYVISLSSEQEEYIKKELPNEIYEATILKENGLYLPDNLYIWATMNSSDQGVSPLDTAFKRRWNYVYISLNKYSKKFGDTSKNYHIGITPNLNVPWETFRTKVNEFLLKERIPEDRLIAPFFIKPDDFNNISDSNKLYLDLEIYKSKILMYLFDDVLRHRRKENIFNENINSYSDLIETFDDNKKTIYSQKLIEALTK